MYRKAFGRSSRWVNRVLLGLLLPLASTRLAEALPPDPELSSWNVDWTKPRLTQAQRDALFQQIKGEQAWNCYNYAVNKKTYKGTKSDGTTPNPKRAHPGKGVKWPDVGKNLTAEEWCDKVIARSKDTDKLKLIEKRYQDADPGTQPAIPEPEVGYNLVVLVTKGGTKFDGGEGDYHWWRRNGDGSWSHKRGSTPAKTTFTESTCSGLPAGTACTGGPGRGTCPVGQTCGVEKPMDDPRKKAQRDGYDLCAFMGVPKNVDVGPLASASGCGPREGATWLASMVSSGMPDIEVILSDADEAGVLARLPTFSPGNEVPNPQWSGVPAGQSAGLILISDEASGSGLPQYLRVVEGVIEVLPLDLTATSLKYYNDNNGLESLLAALLVPIEGGCCTTTGCVQVPECQCIDSGGDYLSDGTPCGPDGICVPTVSQWGLAVMSLLVLAAGTVVVMRHRAGAHGTGV